MVNFQSDAIGVIIFLNHRDRLFCDVFETSNIIKTIITIIGPTINRSDASPKSTLLISRWIISGTNKTGRDRMGRRVDMLQTTETRIENILNFEF